jgi:hypothetical protein
MAAIPWFMIQNKNIWLKKSIQNFYLSFKMILNEASNLMENERETDQP